MLSKLLTLREQIILGALALALLTGSLTMVFGQQRGVPVAAAPPATAKSATATPVSAPVPESVPIPAPPASEAPPATQIGVAIAGAVRQPGLYYLDQGAYVRDLIQRAGGIRADARLEDIDTGARLLDATTLEIPTADATHELHNPAPYLLARAIAVSPVPVGGTAQFVNDSPVPAQDRSGRININTADQAALESLPGIGPALATRIIAYRAALPFRSPEDLLAVSGIGEKKLAALRDLVTTD
ncbi:MAG: ComEA family DNA-binding protein [Candidatus Hydrogenedentes bacterium]|nr:ComEA family DNA-binding protein [Candidatus Hydrogenedentota bacterium]